MLWRIQSVRFGAEVQQAVTDKKTGKPVTKERTKARFADSDCSSAFSPHVLGSDNDGEH
jgi:hypothetical protein